MKHYGYTFKEKFFRSLKRFIFKTFIVLAITIGLTVYFFKSDFGNSVDLIKDFKIHTNEQFISFYQQQSSEFVNSIRQDLGLPVHGAIEKEPITATKQDNKLPVNDNDSHVSTPNNNQDSLIDTSIAKKFVEPSNLSGLSLYKIDYYYDHSNAPNGVSKEEALTIIKKSSQQWTDACGIVFEYKGDKLADYVHNKNVIDGNVGIIKWETQLEGSAIGEAHVGNEQGPASGFVLALFSDFFARNKADLINTITHEMGHVIGLDHSSNKHSVMFATERPSAKLQPADKAMCQYFRYRWSGMNQQQAENKAGVLSNSSYDDN